MTIKHVARDLTLEKALSFRIEVHDFRDIGIYGTGGGLGDMGPHLYRSRYNTFWGKG